MNWIHHLHSQVRRLAQIVFFRSISILTAIALLLGPMAGFPQRVVAAPLAAPTNTLRIRVVSAANNATVISNYKFLINEDNTGDPRRNATDDLSLPRFAACDPLQTPDLAGCDWPSIRAVPGSAPIVTQGDQTLLSASTGLNLQPYLDAHPGVSKFLISVVADGYKIGGLHFSLPAESANLPLVVELQPDPLPLATMRIQVFEDNISPNSQMDAPAELGLNGFEGRISDVLGEISTDWYGNPLCTEYDTNGDPIPGTGGICLSGDTNHDGVVNGSDDPGDRGLIVIPNIGSGRYAAQVIPPDGTDWVQTTTLEGGHDWDTWLQEGATGYDTEFLFAGEPFPWTMFGFVRPRNLTTTGSRTISGRIVGVSVYVPLQGGLPYTGTVWGGLSGARINGPIDRPYIALSDLNNGDQMVYMRRANVDGTFAINNVPDGSYLLTAWDGPQQYLLDFYNVTVSGGNVNMGDLFLTGWFAHFYGSVFIDVNENGKRDPDEKGLPGQAITIRSRGNNLVQHGATGATTNNDGYYDIDQAYPFTAWQIMEVYNDRYYTTGITYQADNESSETTVLGSGVDVNILPIIGLRGRLDWGVKPYVRGENGGIVGTVTYDVTRNELDPRLAAAEDWQPGIPGMTVNLYEAVRNPDGTFATEPDGSYTKGALIDSVITESWERPTDCVARDVDGNPVVQQAFPIPGSGGGCLEAPMSGIQFGPMSDGTNFGATVDGNYGFGDLPKGDYLVEVVSPVDWLGQPLYKVTREEDINVFNGDEYFTQLPPPPCAGALHTVDVAGVGADGPNATDNPNFAAEGGSPYEGQQRHLCDVKLVRLQDGRSIAPTFNFFTEVPLPGRFMGYIVDDLNVSTDPRSTLFGEKAGLPSAPIGLYDFTDRLITTVQSDPNGLFEVLLPSTLQINCPTPSGVCSNMYRLVGNDPGQPGRLNPKHNPQYRTITANFEVWPGVINPADLAPTQIGVSIQGPGSQFNAVSQCAVNGATPSPATDVPLFFAVSKPFVRSTDTGAARQITIYGDAFGTTPGQVLLDTTVMTTVVSWTNTQIVVNVPAASATNMGPRQLMVRASNGQTTPTGLTFHVLTGNGNSTGGGSGTVNATTYNPRILTVNASPAFGSITNFTSIQPALTAAGNNTGTQRYLVVVFPGPTGLYNPTGIYFENLVMFSPVKLQGVGPGGVYADGTNRVGTVIDGVGFTNDNPSSEDWRVLVNSIAQVGNPAIAEGEVIYVIARDTNQFVGAYRAGIDGMTIQGGDQMGFPNNLNLIGGGQTGGGQPQGQGFIETQGGGIFVNGYARFLQITNNILRSNGGAYAGAIRLGTPDLPAPLTNNENDNVRIAYNRIIANGGTNLAGAIGVFSGADNYEIAYNDFCGNFSAEYGGAISHYGLSPNGSIHHNRIYFNQSYDEGGGIMLTGALPVPPATVSAGTGAVSIYNNLIQSNLGNDDGGGVRVLNANNAAINIYNNFIVNNIATDEGGGIAIDTATNVRVINNTLINNITTATAATSDGTPKPAGFSTVGNSPNPVLFNNIFWDNRAGSWNGSTVGGIGLAASPAINLWDLGVVGPGVLAPTNSVLNTTLDTTPSGTNSSANPLVVNEYETSVAVYPWRTNPNLVSAAIVAVDLPVGLLGNYHLQAGSPAINLGAASKAAPIAPNPATAPFFDIDNGPRPVGTTWDAGADEIAGAGFPVNATPLDNFNRANANTVGTDWRGNLGGFYTILNNEARVINGGFVWWCGDAVGAPGACSNAANDFGPNQEAYLTFTKVVNSATDHDLLLKVNNLSATGSLPGTTTSLISVEYKPNTNQVLIRTFCGTAVVGCGVAQQWRTRGTLTGITFNAGDKFGAQTFSNGVVLVYKNGVVIGGTIIPTTGANSWPPALVAGGGRIGMWFLRSGGFGGTNDARFDDFGGGNLP